MINCPKCNSNNIIKDGKHKEFQRYKCKDYNFKFDYGLYENQSKSFYIKYFGVNLKNDNLKLIRENYALIDKKVYNTEHSDFILNYFKENPKEHDKIYENIENTIYTDEWCGNHKKDCLLNFDLNMKYFNNLDFKDFNKNLKKLINKSKKIKEIFDLNECDNMIGIYIMVLDEYKQVYIGQTTSSIKTRIMKHWSKKKEFDKLIFGKVESSILSIESFRPYDKTRIFVYPTDFYSLNKIEAELVEFMNNKYILNRTAGGITGNDIYSQMEILKYQQYCFSVSTNKGLKLRVLVFFYGVKGVSRGSF